MHLPDFIYHQKAIICCAIGFVAGLIADRSPLLTAAQVVLLVLAAIITQLRSPKKSPRTHSNLHQP
jgi:hypothetical protein